MSICEVCEQEMESADSCQPQPLTLVDGKTCPRVRYCDEREDGGDKSGSRCHDCGVVPGGFHHPGCDVERCPRCRGQLLTCGCSDEEAQDEPETTAGYLLFFPDYEFAERAEVALQQQGLTTSMWPTDEDHAWLVLVSFEAPLQGPGSENLDQRLAEITERFRGSNGGWRSIPSAT